MDPALAFYLAWMSLTAKQYSPVQNQTFIATHLNLSLKTEHRKLTFLQIRSVVFPDPKLLRLNHASVCKAGVLPRENTRKFCSINSGIAVDSISRIMYTSGT